MDKCRTIVALALLILAIIYEWNWFWALFIFLGLVHIIRSGEIHFVEFITKKEHPKLYWIMILICSFLAIYSVANHLAFLT